MKLLTLNTHSLLEEGYHVKLNTFIRIILRERPQLMALQEVSQSAAAPALSPDQLPGMVPVPGCSIPIRRDNHAAAAARRLHWAGLPCQWVWLPVKLGYGKYDEGVALFGLGRSISQVDTFPLSRCRDYENWKTRRALGVRLHGRGDWFYSLHMGWWNDPEEPFPFQWKNLERALAQKKNEAPLWLLGDFNSPAQIRQEGYDHIRSFGWQDTYLLAKEKDEGITVDRIIDGWRDPPSAQGLRIDHIWCSQTVPVLRSQTLFTGEREPRVSDHFGVMVETAE